MFLKINQKNLKFLNTVTSKIYFFESILKFSLQITVLFSQTLIHGLDNIKKVDKIYIYFEMGMDYIFLNEIRLFLCMSHSQL